MNKSLFFQNLGEKTENYLDFGLWVRLFMKNNNISLTHLAERSGMSVSNLSPLLKKKELSNHQVIRFSKALRHNFYQEASVAMTKMMMQESTSPESKAEINRQLEVIEAAFAQINRLLGGQEAETTADSMSGEYKFAKLKDLDSLFRNKWANKLDIMNKKNKE
jgi:DNA-binding transcriptional regulator GbsR (MarR family)